MNKRMLLIKAEYLDIILGLIHEPYCFDSLTKIVFTSFCVYNEANINKYSNRKKDLVTIFIENISLKIQLHRDELSIIFEILDILKQQKYIEIEGDAVTICKDCNVQTQNPLLERFALKEINPILEINKLDSKAMLEEVIRYV